MRFTIGVPVAWLNLIHNKRRFLLAVAGISFAVLLMFVQLGFWRALLDGQVQLLRKLDADLFLISRSKMFLTDTERFPLVRLQQARAVAGVQSAQPFYVYDHPLVWKNRIPIPPNRGWLETLFSKEDRSQTEPGLWEWPIRVIGLDLEGPPVFSKEAVPGLERDLNLLRRSGTALLDIRSKPKYDLVKLWREGQPWPPEAEREVGGQSLRLVGVTWLGTDFTAEGTLLMSTTTLSRYPLSPDPRRSPLDLVGLGIIKLAGGASREQVRQGLVAALPQQDVLVLTPEQLESKEMWFWQTATPVGFVFLLGLAVGFVVGVVICYQILATDVTDHLAEYATLKAIGYHGRFLNQVVLQQALWLSLLGFALGISLTWPLYWKLEDATGLPLQLTLLRIGLILLLTVGMCILSGLLALRRVRTLDPAEVF